MFKIIFLLSSFLFAINAENNLRGVSTEQKDWSEFINFQQKFDKSYKNIQELEHRFEIFTYNLHNIIIHNLQIISLLVDHYVKHHHEHLTFILNFKNY